MKRRKFTAKFKFKVVLDALKEVQTVNEIAQKHKLAPSQISSWKKDFLLNGERVFETGKTQVKNETELERDRLLRSIGELKVENDFLKKVLK